MTRIHTFDISKHPDLKTRTYLLVSLHLKVKAVYEKKDRIERYCKGRQVIWAELSTTFEALSCNSLDVHLLEANPTGLLDTCQYTKVGNVIRLEAKIKNLMQTPGFSSLGELMSLSIKRKKKNWKENKKIFSVKLKKIYRTLLLTCCHFFSQHLLNKV